ncbi:MAG: ImmA/IrrE family metallo-endopeptidase [Deltaproteobacteria bacterium]
MRVPIKPELLRWARERARTDVEALLHRFPRLPAWERGELQPTLKQVERFAKAVHAPVGFLFLETPPVETLAIPDLRTVGNARPKRPSPDLLEMIYVCQQRQEWYRDFARATREEPLAFVGSANLSSGIQATAARIRHALGFELEEQCQAATWIEALGRFIERADAAGVLVMCSGIVQNDTHRPLDPDEFRGFALADALAPLVFVNGADSKAAQLFTLAHELAHLWLGASAVSDAQAAWMPEERVERWCNQVAAELLVPLAALRREYRKDTELHAEVRRFARLFKVSTVVLLRRVHDLGAIGWDQLRAAYADELERLGARPKASGGSFYLTQSARVRWPMRSRRRKHWWRSGWAAEAAREGTRVRLAFQIR